ncbi:sensor histidine kinase [Virgibacillus profundi]|nr:sensor histidine kinase [Virgibacillus profundi]
MRDFLKDNLPFILFFYSQCVLIIGIAQLASIIAGQSMGPDILIYLIVLPTFCLIVFLLFRYGKFRDFYIKHEQAIESFPEAPNHLLENIKRQHDIKTNRYAEEVDKLEQQKQLEFNFIQQWVHQMKTPVSVMHLTMQKEKLNLPEDYYHSMTEELERLQQGLDLVLYQSRLQKFDRDFHVQKLALKPMVTDVIQEFKSSFIRHHVFPTVTIDETITVATDPKWFRFVITQLLSNAIKYSKESSDKIYFTVMEKAKTLTLEIRDTGHGIPTQDLNRVFDPFFTGLNGRTFRESTGMGLYLSKQICDALGHDLEITSVQDKGTAVTITFQNP